jgi:hypothetical protein
MPDLDRQTPQNLDSGRHFFNIRVLRIAAAALVAFHLAKPAIADSIIVNTIPTDACLFCLDGFPEGPFALAGSFVFNGLNGTLLRTVGAYMQRAGDGPRPGTGTPFRFEVLADDKNRPDAASVLSPPVAPDAGALPGDDYLPSGRLTLSLVTALLDVPVPLQNGARYWIAATTLPFSSNGSYQVGIRPGTGAFALSFDPTGMHFFNAEDVGLDPLTDLAIYASGTAPIPEPATFALLCSGMLGLAFRWTKASADRLNG